jgi:hypothetical protein
MKKLAALLFVILFISGVSYSQFKLKLGPTTGMNFNLHTGSDIESGSGFGFIIGGQLDMSFTPTVGLITNMQFYDNRSGSTTKEGSNQYQDGQGNPVTSTVEDGNSVSLAYFMIEPLFKLNLPGSGMYFVGGPAFGFNVEGSFERTITETLPPPYTFQNNQNTQTQKAKGSMKELLVRLALKFGAGYDIWVGSVIITPQVNFEYGIVKVQSDVAWRVLTIQALGTVKFPLL